MEVSGKVLAEYVWLGPAGVLRNKTKVLEAKPISVEELPVITVTDEGLHNGQSCESYSSCELVLKPRKMFRDPFRGGEHLLVLCDPYIPPQVVPGAPEQPLPALQPHPSNFRAPCEAVLAQAQHEAPIFAAEQEYWIEEEDNAPMCEPHGSWPHAHLPDPSKPQLYGPHGEMAQTIPALRGTSLARAAAARKLSESHLHCCLKAGLTITGCGEGTQPGRWSYKLGPMPGTELGDQLWLSRHLLIRLAEAMCIPLSFDPGEEARPVSCLVKYSTAASRTPGMGMAVLQQHLGRLQASHVHNMLAYGLSKGPDLTDAAATAAAPPAAAAPACATGSMQAPVSIPLSSVLRGCGCLVDRRPRANADPWAVIMVLVSATLSLEEMQPPAGPSTSGSCNSQQVAAAGAVMQSIHAAMVTAQQQQQQVVLTAMLPANVAAFYATAAAAAAQAPCAGFAVPSCSEGAAEGDDVDDGLSWDSWECDSLPSASMCTEDVLLQELDRMDGYFAEGGQHMGKLCGPALSMSASCSEATSPETEVTDDASSHMCIPEVIVDGADCARSAPRAKRSRQEAAGCSAPAVMAGHMHLQERHGFAVACGSGVHGDSVSGVGGCAVVGA